MSRPPLQIVLIEPVAAERARIAALLQDVTELPLAICEVATGADALQLCRAGTSIDLLFLASELPDLRSIHLLQLLKQKKTALLSVIILADQGEDPDLAELLAMGAQEFVVRHELSPQLLLHFLRNANRRRAWSSSKGTVAEEPTASYPLLDELPFMIWLADAEMASTFFNREWLAFTGNSLDAEHHHSWQRLTHPDDVEARLACYQQAYQLRQPFTIEYRLRRHDGVYRWLIDRGMPRYAHDGTFLGFIGAAIDITERVEAEEAQQQRENRLRALFAAIPDTVACLNTAGIFLESYQSGDSSFLDRAATMVGSNLFEIMPPELARKIYAAHLQVIATNQIQTLEYVRTVNGDEAYFEARIAKSGPDETIAIVRNVTERRRAEELIRYQASLLENVSDAIISTDLESNILSWNPAAERLYGYTAEEVLGQNFFKALKLPNPQERRSRAMALLGKRGQLYIEPIHYHRDGKPIQIQSLISFVFDQDGQRIGVVCVNRDVTQQKRAEELLLRVQKYESTSLLASGIAHDFNNLLTSVLGQISLAQQKLVADNSIRNHLQKAIRSTERAADLARQLLAYTGQGAFQLQLLDLNEIIRDNLGLFETVLPKGADLDVRLAPDLTTVEMDRGQLQQVIMNLMINAAEAIPASGGRITITTELRELTLESDQSDFHPADLHPGRYCCLTVKDNGIGMSKQTLERIFDPYFTTKKTGSGLGLSAILGIVQHAGGAVQVISQSGEGAQFSIFLPALTSTVPNVFVSPPSSQVQTKGKVLVVDDEPLVREVISDILNEAGIESMLATDGAEGVQLFTEVRDEIALVVLDMKMPGMSGEQVFHAIRALEPTCRVILSSGYLDNDALNHLTRQQFTSFLRKPYDWEVLLATVQRMLGETQQSQN